jgi:3-oxoacyl-[acyl-carrier protein] reductase
VDQALVAKFSLDGRGAVVVGAASGIGRQAAITFAQAGARLIIADQNAAGLEETRALAGGGEIVVLDVRDRAQVQALGDQAARGGGVEVWANVAGFIANFPVVEATEEAIDRLLAVNLKGTYWGCAAAARLMVPQGRGSIINISSAAADFPSPGLSAYGMTKAAVNMLTRNLAQEVAPHGVRANAVAPGYIDTPFVTYRFRDAEGRLDEAKRDQTFVTRAANTPLRRIGRPDDVAMAMLYLASDASSFVTGQVLRPNGGAAMP